MCTLKLPKTVISHIDRAQKHCLWRGSVDLHGKSKSPAAWSMVCKPKKRGGINQALLMKNLHKFYNRQDLPWTHLIWSTYYDQEVPHVARECGSFWWQDIMRMATTLPNLIAEGKRLLIRIHLVD